MSQGEKVILTGSKIKSKKENRNSLITRYCFGVSVLTCTVVRTQHSDLSLWTQKTKEIFRCHSHFFIHQAMGSCLVCGWCGAWPCWRYWGVWCAAVAALGMYTPLYLSDWPQPQECTPRHWGRLLQPWPQWARPLCCLSLPFNVTLLLPLSSRVYHPTY